MHIIKVCGMRDAQNIKKVSALPIDYIGFIFYSKSPRFVENEQSTPFSKAFLRSIKPKKVGVFVNAPLEIILQKVVDFDLQAIQLHGNETPDFIQDLRPQISHQINIFKAFSIDESFDFERLKYFENIVDKFLFDTKTPQYGGSGHKFDWDLLQKYEGKTPFLLAGGIGIADTEGVKNWKHSRFEGLDLNSRFEVSPALKDVDLLYEFISRLHQ